MKRILFLFAAFFPVVCLALPYEVSVTSVEEFLKALGNDRTIIVAKGNYKVSDFTELKGEHFGFEEHYNGKELVITGLSNLVIKGVDNQLTHIIAEPTYGNVIVFRNCSNIRIENLRAGHGEQKGECVGGVFSFSECSGIALQDCRLYGSGIEGITAQKCLGFKMTNCWIYGCSYSICTLDQCSNFLFQDCKMFDNQEFQMVNVSASKKIVFKTCKFSKNEVKAENIGYGMFAIQDSRPVKLDHCTVIDNKADHFCNNPKLLKTKGCTIPSSQWRISLAPKEGE